MAFTVKTMVKNFDELVKNYRPALEQGMKEGVEVWLGRQQRKQMSGRPGLRTITGTLKRGWRVRARGKGAGRFFGFRVKVFSTVKYAAPHEFGKLKVPSHTRGPYTRKVLTKRQRATGVLTKSGKRKRGRGSVAVRAHRVRGYTINMPKRLHMRESFRNDAPRIILKGMTKRLNRAVKEAA